jgi:hypothetical protein
MEIAGKYFITPDGFSQKRDEPQTGARGIQEVILTRPVFLPVADRALRRARC